MRVHSYKTLGQISWINWFEYILKNDVCGEILPPSSRGQTEDPDLSYLSQQGVRLWQGNSLISSWGPLCLLSVPKGQKLSRDSGLKTTTWVTLGWIAANSIPWAFTPVWVRKHASVLWCVSVRYYYDGNSRNACIFLARFLLIWDKKNYIF